VSKKIDVSHEVPAPVEAVYAAITGETWADHKAEAFADEARTESRTVGDGGAVTLVMSRGLPPGIPGFLEKFLPKGGRATQTEAWGPAKDGVRSGTWQGEIPGAPAKVGGTMSLSPSATGTTYRIQGEVKVSIPLVGGKAESFVAEMIEKLTRSEAELLTTLTS
jgi:hypothetical protein